VGVPRTPPCPLCRAPSATLYEGCHDYEYFTAGQQTFRRCSRCRLVFIDPMPRRDELPALYPPHYHNFDGPRNALSRFLFERYYAHHCRIAARLLPAGGAVLEVGAGSGDLLAHLRARGVRRVAGVEISRDGRERACAKGLDVFHGTIEEYETDERFDLVFMSHVIEHVTDPVGTLRAARRLLNENGHLYLETPNVGALDARVWKADWGLIHYPRHLYLFDRATLADVVRRAGFSVLRQSFEMNSCGWALSIQSALRRRGLDRNRRPRSAYYPLLLVLLMPLNLVDLLSGGTAFMSLVARRNGSGPEVAR